MNVGDYVRTPQGIIAKIINIKEDTGQYFLNGNAVSLESKNYIADKNITIGENFKHSPNIIDLLKKKDIVIDYKGNIYQVDKIFKDYVFTDKKNKYGQIITLVDYQIKKVITKEEFSSIGYEVN